MGRPPCCDKVGIKKGPWTPEEDIILVSYIQEHGPGNWRSVPTNTGLLRCSKSCRLRWTNYLRPGIKRGNFTAHEEGMIIHLQALLGNKWASIASYLPQRTDNDIKNYWNTHLKKKLKKFQSALDPMSQDSSTNPTSQFVTKSFSDRKSSLDITANSSSLCELNQTNSTYASSTENISRLLEGWMRSSPKSNNCSIALKENWRQNKTNNLENTDEISICNNSMPSVSGYKPKSEQHEGGNNDLISHEEFESILSFENLNGASWEKSTTCESATTTLKGTTNDEKENNNNNSNNNNNNNNNNTIDNSVITLMTEKKQKSDNSGNPPLTFLEKWLLEESTTPGVEEVMELSPIF